MFYLSSILRFISLSLIVSILAASCGGGGGGGNTNNTLDYHASQIAGFKDDRDAVIDYAKKAGLNSFNGDALLGNPPNSTEIYIRKNYQDRDDIQNYLPGENRVKDYTLTFNNAISINLDPQEINYPADYQQQESDIAVPDPYCNPNPVNSTFPKSYLGSFELPSINIVSASTPYQKIGSIKDVWLPLYPNYVTGCQDDIYENFSNTLSRMKQLNIDTVAVTPWTAIDSSVSPWRVLSPAELNSSIIGDEDLAWIVQRAKELGFKVIWANQILHFSEPGGDILPFADQTVENARKTFGAVAPYLEERANYLQSLGVDGIMLGPWYWANMWDILPEAEYISETTALLTKIKNNFSGDIIYEYDESLLSDNTANSLVDFYDIAPWSNIPESEFSQVSVNYIKPQYKSALDHMAQQLGGKPIILHASEPSYYLEKYRYIETPFCTGVDPKDYTGDIKPFCYQETVPTEFGMQAILVESKLEAAFEETRLNIEGVMVQYWMDDNVLPSTTFPNLAYSIRGKPVESVIYQWFR